MGYLHKLRTKKGFTLVELIIVIAIIAILSAMILPMFSSNQAKKDAADIYASDCYSGLQYNFTRYQKTEADITPQFALPAEQTYLKFSSEASGNVLTSAIYIEIKYDQGIKYVHVAGTLFDLVNAGTGASSTELERLIQNDMEDIVNGGSKGYYYAKVDMDSKNNLKVKTVHFTEDRLPEISGSSTEYAKNNLLFIDYGMLACDTICGTCSSEKASNDYIGGISTYFMNEKG